MESLNDRDVFDEQPLEQTRETYKDEYSEDMLKIFLSGDTPHKKVERRWQEKRKTNNRLFKKCKCKSAFKNRRT